LTVQEGLVAFDPILEEALVVESRDGHRVPGDQHCAESSFALVLEVSISTNRNTDITEVGFGSAKGTTHFRACWTSKCSSSEVQGRVQ